MGGQVRFVIDQADGAGAADRLLRLSGELDMNSARQLRQVFAGIDAPERVLVDLSALTFCDSSGLSALLAGHKKLEAQGGRLVLGAVPPRIRSILELTGLAEVFAFAGPAGGPVGAGGETPR